MAINICCHDVGLRKQHLGYHNASDCLYVILLLLFWALHCVDLAVLTDGRWKIAATYCNNIRCHHCGMML